MARVSRAHYGHDRFDRISTFQQKYFNVSSVYIWVLHYFCHEMSMLCFLLDLCISYLVCSGKWNKYWKSWVALLQGSLSINPLGRVIWGKLSLVRVIQCVIHPQSASYWYCYNIEINIERYSIHQYFNIKMLYSPSF